MKLVLLNNGETINLHKAFDFVEEFDDIISVLDEMRLDLSDRVENLLDNEDEEISYL